MNRRISQVLLVLLVSTGVAACRSDVRFEPGVLAPQAPRQTSLDRNPVFVRDDYLLRAIARFEVDARVLGRERYRFDRGADLSPLDLALGWGPMSDQQVIDRVTVTQSRRFYWWRVSEYPVPRHAIMENSANMHMIPADTDVQRELMRVRTGDLISFSGYLVNVSSEDGFRWRSSTTRTDTGNGACELVFVEQVVVRDRP